MHMTTELFTTMHWFSGWVCLMCSCSRQPRAEHQLEEQFHSCSQVPKEATQLPRFCFCFLYLMQLDKTEQPEVKGELQAREDLRTTKYS